MKPALIILALFLCNQSFSQQINNEDTELPALITLKYPNIKEALIKKNSLNNDSFLFLETNSSLSTNFTKENGRHINRNFAFATSEKIILSKELLKITHRYPGDGSNLVIDAKGLLVP